MKLSRLTIALYVGLIFASGVVLGVFGHSLYSVAHAATDPPRPTKPEDVRKKTLAMMRERMNLSDAQVTQINSIYDDLRVHFHEVRERYRPEMDALQKDSRNRVRAILSPQQVMEYEKMLKEQDQRQKQNGGRGPGPGM